VDHLTIQENHSLASREGLTELESVETLDIRGNRSLASLNGLSALDTVTVGINISGNDALQSLGGLSALQLAGRLTVKDNDGLTSLDGINPALRFAWTLAIDNNDALTTLDGLPALQWVGEHLTITNNRLLSHLDALFDVRAIGGDVTISENDALKNLDGLSRVASIGGDLSVSGNSELSECSCGLYGCVDLLGGIAGSIRMHSNAVGGDCNNDGADLTGSVCAVGVYEEDVRSESPQEFALYGNYPNPFNPSTSIRFDLPEAGEVTLVVFDLLGREVARVLDRTLDAGQHAVTWDAGDLPSGVYLYRVEAGGSLDTRTLVLLK
jgi:hypothetical protein